MRKPLLRDRLTLSVEAFLFQQGIKYIAGVDEVGRGSLAGPVVAASCILPQHHALQGLADSKQLSRKQRETLFPHIQQVAISWAVARVEANEIDRLNILQASLKAMKWAVEGLAVKPDYLLIDGRKNISVSMPQLPICKGDASCAAISAASILAKVIRDRWMTEYEATYPRFSFSKHKGYGTNLHRTEIATYGITPLHRISFAGVKIP